MWAKESLIFFADNVEYNVIFSPVGFFDFIIPKYFPFVYFG